MSILKTKLARLKQRKARVSGAVRAVSTRPRLSIHRSVKHIYAQIIDDATGKTLLAINSGQKEPGQTKTPRRYRGGVLARKGNVRARPEYSRPACLFGLA